MIIETYIATLQHDKGRVRLQVASMRGKQGAIQQIMAIKIAQRNPSLD